MGETPAVFRWRVAAFDGLRFVMGHVRHIAVWTLLVLALVYGVVFAGYAAGFTPDSYFLPAANTQFVSIALIPVGVVAAAMICCAAYRAVLTPEASAFAYLRLGADEARMTLVFAAIVAGMAAAATIGAMIGLWAIATSLVAFALLCRVSLVGPSMFRDHRFSLVSAWRLGGEWFWNLALLNLLTGILGLVVAGMGSWVRQLAMVSNYDVLQADAEVGAAQWVLRLVLTNGVVVFLYTAAFVTLIVPGMVVHRELVADPDPDAEPVAEVFS